MHGAKTTKNQTPLVGFAWLFYNQTVFQKFERSYHMTDWPTDHRRGYFSKFLILSLIFQAY